MIGLAELAPPPAIIAEAPMLLEPCFCAECRLEAARAARLGEAPAIQWKLPLWGRRGEPVAGTYQSRLF